MFALFLILLSAEDLLGKVRRQSYENQGLTRNYSIDYQVNPKAETYLIDRCFFVDIPSSGTTRAIWYNNDQGIFAMYKSILIRTTGFRAWGEQIIVEDACGFECQGAAGNEKDGKFCWVGQQSNDGKFPLKLENINLRACGNVKNGDPRGSIYAKGWDSHYDSRVISYKSNNLTDCNVDREAVLGYLEYANKLEGQFLNFVKCEQNGGQGAFYFYKIVSNCEISNANFINITAGGADVVKAEECGGRKATNILFLNPSWEIGGNLFRPMESFTFSNISVVNPARGIPPLTTVLSASSMSLPNANLIDCIYVDKVWSNGYTVTPSDKFSQSQIFSPSTKFSSSKQFSSSAIFSSSNNFSFSNEFSVSDDLTFSDEFSQSLIFSSSNSFLLSSNFDESDVFSQTGTKIFSSSKKFSLSSIFSKTLFSSSKKFSSSIKFSRSNKFVSTFDFSISSTFVPLLNDSPPQQILGLKPVYFYLIIAALALIVLVLTFILIRCYCKRKGKQKEKSSSNHELNEFETIPLPRNSNDDHDIDDIFINEMEENAEL